jgi:hypothetical protein
MERILIYTGNFYADTIQVRRTLESRDIHFFVEDEHAAALGYGAATGGIKIFVRKEDFTKAVKAFLEDQVISEQEAKAALEGWE